LLLALLWLAAPALAVEGPDAVQAHGREGDLVLWASGPASRLVFADGHELGLPLQPGSEIASLAATDTGWLAAGSYRAADGGRRLLLLAGDATAMRSFEAPIATHHDQRFPVWMVDDGDLVGLAWLEGDSERSYAVFAARWNGSGWEDPERVAPAGPGSQLAATGAVLRDHSWLLAWSAYDGRDDEILYSRRVAGRWTPAARIAADNDVPDITPSLVAVGAGALLAWSRFDGSDYRLLTARWDGRDWRPAGASGPPGSLYPVLLARGEEPVQLLFYTAESAAWTVAELAPTGKRLAIARDASPRRERPAARRTADRSLRLSWMAPAGESRPRWEAP
jgi:hypothetical protein